MFKVHLIGAGQIGSRHLQALKKVNLPLNITVTDLSKESLLTAQKRYQEINIPKEIHTINFVQHIPKNEKIDLAIIATTSKVRAEVTGNLLKKNQVRFMILEKLLFDKKKDYQTVEKLFLKNKVRAWVNCPLRLRPTYQRIKKQFMDKNISFRLTGSQLSLATNGIHYIDVLSYLTGKNDFSINTNFLDKKIKLSKRKGFLELNGTLYANFDNGTKCELTSYPSGNAPSFIELFNQEARYMFLDQKTDSQAWVSTAKNGWGWKKVSFHTPLISETTTVAVENILRSGTCGLTPYHESVKIHLAFLEPLKKFLNQNSKKKYDHYPFT